MIKQFIKIVFTLTVAFSITACGGGSSSDTPDSNHHQKTKQNNNQQELNIESIDLSEYNENIIISTVDAEGNPVAGTWVQWIVADVTAEEMIDAVCIDDQCTTWVIDQFPTNTIRVEATKYVEWENDQNCYYAFAGEKYIDTSIQEVQKVQIIVEPIPDICE
ncbi:MAG: hypothetical protein D6B28_05035 [Gammaproteobacteria bacterium]|nr:MAG: hypothetical protein D6B28_05035 [Gammaproteobacteria bacterium]